MMKRNSVLLAVTFLLLTGATYAQDQSIEYGRFEELRGVQKIFVDAGEDIALRNIIKDILERELHLQVVERPEDAEHTMIFKWSSGGSLLFGSAIVAKRISTERLRVISSYRASEAELDDLTVEYAKWFVKRFRLLSGP